MKNLKDTDVYPFDRNHPYFGSTVNDIFKMHPSYLLWLLKNTKVYKLSEGMRSKLKKYQKDNNIIIERGNNVMINTSK